MVSLPTHDRESAGRIHRRFVKFWLQVSVEVAVPRAFGQRLVGMASTTIAIP